MGAVKARRLAIALAWGGMVLPAGARAEGATEVTSDTTSQFYDVRSPTGQTVLTRRRVTTTMAVHDTELLGVRPWDPKAPELSFRARLRYDADYGADASETDVNNLQRFVPGASQGAVDLMFAYLEGRRFLGGILGFRLGRQYVVDVLGAWAFDGAHVTVTTPFFVRAEAFGGLEERSGMPLATSRFESDGVFRGDRTSYGRGVNELYPSFQPEGLAPAFGAALESVGPTWIHARLVYRRIEENGPSSVSLFRSGLYPPATYEKERMASERLGYAFDSSWSKVGAVKAGIVYDGYRSEVTSVYASFDESATRHVTLSADYDYSVPTFDGDSIWNLFMSDPKSDLGLRANFDATALASVSAGAHARVTGVGSSSSPAAHRFDEGGSVSARYRTGDTRVTLRANGDFGQEGDRVGGDLSGERIFETRYVLKGRAGVYQWRDALRPDRATTSFGYDAGLGYRFAPRSQGAVSWEHEVSSLVGERFRIVLTLSLGLPQ